MCACFQNCRVSLFPLGDRLMGLLYLSIRYPYDNPIPVMIGWNKASCLKNLPQSQFNPSTKFGGVGCLLSKPIENISLSRSLRSFVPKEPPEDQEVLMQKLRAKLGPKPKMIIWPKCKEVEETVKKRVQAPWLNYLLEGSGSIAAEGSQ